MKKTIYGIAILVSGLIYSCQTMPDAVSGASKPMAQNGNSLYHQTESISLQAGELAIEGEVKNPGKVYLDLFYQREVVIKEARYDEVQGIDFIGAYRYKGYSLFDLLHPYNYQKKNKEEFPPSIDLFLTIENDKGEKVVFSWSEIFHVNIPHQILIATEMAPIVPYKKEVDYPVATAWKVVAAGDLFAYRMLENPVKITVETFNEKDYTIQKGIKPMFSPSVNVVLENGEEFVIEQITNEAAYTKYYTGFYGMGMGYHPAKYFSGPQLDSFFEDKIDLFDPRQIAGGLVCFVGLDGYRTIYSYSELFNRTDQVAPILAIGENPKDGGFYRIFHPAEFYADRSVKSLQEIYFFNRRK
jgi:hypothetical protein